MMLLDFTVRNFLCFKDEVKFSMIASSDKSHENHVINKTQAKNTRVLRCSGLYGANGHGKTKFVRAIQFLQNIVVKGSDPKKKIFWHGFKLQRQGNNSPCEFNIRFHHSGIDYDYGIIVDSRIILREWLYSREKTKEVVLFERATVRDEEAKTLEISEKAFSVNLPDDEYKNEGYKTYYEFGASLKKSTPKILGSSSEGFLQYVAQGTRPNQPFLKEAAERNIPPLLSPFEWFSHSLVVISADATYSALHARAYKEPSFIDFISNFMNATDVGIDKVTLNKTKINSEHILNTIPDEDKQAFMNACSDGKIISVDRTEGESISITQNEDGSFTLLRLETGHKRDDGETVYFNISDESAGTIRMINLIPMLIDSKQRSLVFIVDELDRKLHPILSYKFIDAFLNGSSSNSKSQIIFTTHNTHLLNLDLLRRDEVWFTEKNKFGAATLYSLINLRTRSDINIEKGYLQGRFGAIPFVGNIRDLGWHNVKAKNSRGDEEKIYTEKLEY